MKLIIASDIHGSAEAAYKLADIAEAETPDKLVLLGDILYHGPRNNLPVGHGPAEAADALNSIASKILAVRGNCDAEVDQMMLDFPCMSDYALLVDGEHTLFFTHGHISQMTPSDAENYCIGFSRCEKELTHFSGISAYCSGHTHVKKLEKLEGKNLLIMLNPGSTSIPRDGSASYAIYENGSFSLRDFSGCILKEVSF